MCFHNWNHCQKILEGFKKFGFLQKDNIYVEQRYGPITTWRRNEAKKLRKLLKEKKEILSGYVAYPAKLMVKHSKEGKYFLHTDFSNAEVTV